MNNEKVTRKKLNELAKENGIKYYLKYNRFELAEKLLVLKYQGQNRSQKEFIRVQFKFRTKHFQV